MAASDDFGPTSHSFVSHRLTLNYLDWGNAGAPMLILVHGGRDHARSWDWVARALRDDWHIIVPDLRGHGDSAWSPDGAYMTPYFIYDFAQLIRQQGEVPVAIVAHSYGGWIASRYAGLYPEHIRKLVVIEGLGFTPEEARKRRETPVEERWQSWIDGERALAGRSPRRYATIEDALARMRTENKHLSEAQARHLTIHGVRRNEDGSYGWKFDNYARTGPPVDIGDEELQRLWGRIACPVLLMHGQDSWASNPEQDGRARHFRDARVVSFANAGHWLHHDRLDDFLAELRAFL